MEQRKQIFIKDIPFEKPLTRLEVEAIVEVKLDPYKKAINPDSAPYLSVAHFLWGIGLLVTILSTLLGYIWKKISSSSARLHERIDDSNEDIEGREDKLRVEFNQKTERLDDRVWKLGLHLEIKSGDIIVMGEPENKSNNSLTDKKKK